MDIVDNLKYLGIRDFNWVLMLRKPDNSLLMFKVLIVFVLLAIYNVFSKIIYDARVYTINMHL